MLFCFKIIEFMSIIIDFIKHSLVCFITSFGFLFLLAILANNTFSAYIILLIWGMYLALWNCIFLIPSFIITRMYSSSIIVIVFCLGYVFFIYRMMDYYENSSIYTQPEYYKRENVSSTLWYIESLLIKL